MSDIASITFDTLLVYVVPASIVELLFLYLFGDRLNLRLNAGSEPYVFLSFIGLSVIVGLLLHMFSTVITTITNWQHRKRNLILFGQRGRLSLLFKYLEKLYPNVTTRDRVELVYAIFNSCVPEHIYQRRNWDWHFYQASRNILTSSPIFIIGIILLALRDSWSITLLATTLVIIIVILGITYSFMLRQLDIYYGYYADVVLGYLLEQSDQSAASDQSLANK